MDEILVELLTNPAAHSDQRLLLLETKGFGGANPCNMLAAQRHLRRPTGILLQSRHRPLYHVVFINSIVLWAHPHLQLMRAPPPLCRQHQRRFKTPLALEAAAI